MKLVCFSDAHWLFPEVQVPPGDVLIYAGDWCSGEDMKNTVAFAAYLRKFKHKHKIVIAGNHDRLAERNPHMVKEIFYEEGIIYLQDSGVTINGISFYGTPWTPEFCNWAFMLPDEDLKKKWKGIPDNLDVLITHGPAFGILDRLPNEGSVGSKTLEEAIIQKKPRIHICGHIHNGHGKMESEHTYYYNVAVCDDDYILQHKPTVIDL